MAPPFPQGIAGGHPEDGGRRDREDSPLLEPCRDLGGPLPQEQLGIDEGHLPDLVVDPVVHVPLQLAAADEELLAALPDLQGVEVEGGAVSAAGRVVAKPERELRGRPLRQQEVHRRPVERIGDLRRSEAGGIGERREVGEHDVPVTHHRLGLRVAGAGEQAILAIEQGRVARHREAELLEIGVTRPRHRALRTVEQDAHLKGGGVEVLAGHPVDVPHLLAEAAAALGLLRFGDQLQYVVGSGSSTSGKVPTVVPAAVRKLTARWSAWSSFVPRTIQRPESLR